MNIFTPLLVLVCTIVTCGIARADFGFPAVVFSSNSSALNDQSREIAKEAASILQRYPKCNLTLIGSRGMSEEVTNISAKRIVSVATALTEFGISRNRISFRNLDDLKARQIQCAPDRDIQYCEEFVRTVEFQFTACAL